MRYITPILFGTLASANALTTRATTAFPAGTVFDIVLQGSDIVASTYEKSSSPVIDIDLEDNEDIIADLAKSKTVICYFSAGSREDWRSDAGDFAAADYGQGLEGWEGENWLDVKSENVKSIMKARIERAAKAGCHAVDPDNVDGYNGNQAGFGYDASAYVTYIKYLASVAATNNLSIGLKNAIEVIDDVVDSVQFAVNEQCHAFKECSSYEPFTTANKAVFNIEYGLDDCSDPTGVNLSTVVKSADETLDALGGQC
ncbi:hypothetical protein P280DRAFT_505829 [Massarina eburnea CBS 473.64]|uniref:alpha-galactosidase n=1 Tax=Massarina eburnea CBS 473.64 TaxID=1395130 RepID=A0A6A6S480_9PLEO|nr:hypothetical protein P280DRAFT_505829 [Massarina eburnea CBS 473.64]